VLIKAELLEPLNKLFMRNEMIKMRSWVDYAMFQNRSKEILTGFETIKKGIVKKCCNKFVKLVIF